MGKAYNEIYQERYFVRVMTSYLNRLRNRCVVTEQPITKWQCRDIDYISQDERRVLSDWRNIDVGDSWLGKTVEFFATVTIPPQLSGAPVWFVFDNDGECLMFVDGTPVCGFDPSRDRHKLCDSAVGGANYEIVVESCFKAQKFTNGVHTGLTYDRHLFKRAALVVVDDFLVEIVTDLDCLFEYYRSTKNEDALDIINFARIHFSPDMDSHAFAMGAKNVKTRIDEYFVKSKLSKSGTNTMYAIGHSHLDLAYLWPVKETVRKCARTFSNTLGLMDLYPDFRFTQSQPALYMWAKKYYPDIYARVKEYVAQGRWEVTGGMYVESDANLPSGESLVRQMLYGAKFVKDEFGISMDTCWLPDTFGFSAILPQIIKKSGMKYFYTAKTTKNTVNEFPHNVFLWEGIDGSQVVGTVDTYWEYASGMTLDHILEGQKLYKGKKNLRETMYVYGNGDGGGGVTRQMLERAQRFDKFTGVPNVKLATSNEFFGLVEQKAQNLAVWQGELYFEWHQGTYTSQTLLKKLNRMCEQKLKDAELAMVMAKTFDRQDAAILSEAWHKVLFNQFHDILAGSILEETAKISTSELESALAAANSVFDRNISAVVKQSHPQGLCEQTALLNTQSFERTELVKLPQNLCHGVVGVVDMRTNKNVQISKNSDGTLAFVAERVAPTSCAQYRLLRGDSATIYTAQNPVDSANGQECLIAREISGQIVVENSAISVYFDAASGNITKMFDKEVGRDILSGMANYFEVFSEIYDYYDSWNISPETLAHPQILNNVESFEIVENTPLYAKIKIVRRFSKSTICQYITLNAHSKQLDFETQVDWQEVGVMLKVAFDANVYSSKATFDLDYGSIERSTKTNTTWESVQHEVCAHKWADLSDAHYGVAILNNCKYGHDIKNNKMRLTLLKAPRYPDATCDVGLHTFTYALLPHIGDWRAANVDHAALSLNSPLVVLEAGDSANSQNKFIGQSYITIDKPGVLVSAVKYSEDGTGDVILRTYENRGGKCSTKVSLPLASATKIFECNMLEENICEVEFSKVVSETAEGKIGTSFETSMTAFEVKTFRIQISGTQIV